MSKRMVTLKKTMLLLSMGGAAFTFGIFGGSDLGCVRNSDLVTFYQGVGDASVEAFVDASEGVLGSDFDDIVIAPTQTLWTGMWDNWVAQQFPLDVDPDAANLLRQ